MFYGTEKATTEAEFKLFNEGKLTQVSATMIGAARRCPQSAGFRYVLGIRKKPKRYFPLGKAVDRAIEMGLKTQASPKRAPDLARDIGVPTYREAVAEGIDWNGDSPKTAQQEDEAKIIRIVEAYWPAEGAKLKLATDYPPQTEIKVTLKSGLVVTATPDFITEDARGHLHVKDLKTSKTPWPEGKEDDQDQVDLYPWAVSMHAKGKKVLDMEFHICTPQVREVKIDKRLVIVRPDRIGKLPVLIQTFADFYSDLHKRGGMGVPIVNKFTCGLCDYRSECEETYGGERPSFGKRE